MNSVAGYNLLNEIGSGSQARVFLGISEDRETKAAVKILHSHLLDKERSFERFQREAELVAELDSEYVVQVYDSGVIDNTPFIVMEYVESTLRNHLVKNEGLLEEAEIIQIAIDICLGLEAADSKLMVHRDLKPENVMITDEGRAKIADFGIAKAFESTTLTLTGYPVGTPSYMSPQQSSGHEIDIRSDLYSLGIILYELVSGSPPYTSPNPWHLIKLHQEAPVIDVRKANPHISPNVAHVIEKLIQKDPSDRYQSPQELRRELEALKDEGRSLATPVLNKSHKGLLKRFSWRNLLVAGAGFGLVVLAFLLATTFNSGTRPPESPESVSQPESITQTSPSVPDNSPEEILSSSSLTNQVGITKIEVNLAETPLAVEQSPLPVVTEVFVPADSGWIAAGINLSEGDLVEIQAAGLAQNAGASYSSPDGTSTQGVWFNAKDSSPVNRWPAKHLPGHALVARVGESGDPIFIGNGTVFNAQDSGEIYLAMNDRDDALHDNSGGWSVSVTVGEGEAGGQDSAPQIVDYEFTEDGRGIILSWTDESDFETGYAIFRRDRLGEQVESVGPNVTRAEIRTNIESEAFQCLFIRAFDESGLRLSSELLCFQMPSLSPITVGPNETTPLPFPRTNHEAVKIGDFVYVIGGNNTIRLADVVYTKVNADGGFNEWNSTSSLQNRRAETTAAASDKHIYVIGGTPADEEETSIEVANISPNGSLGAWKYATPIPYPITETGAVIVNDRLYVVGGIASSPSHPSVKTAVFAEINPLDGSLGNWVETSPMVMPRGSHGLITADGYIFAIGGWDNSGIIYLTRISIHDTLSLDGSVLALSSSL